MGNSWGVGPLRVSQDTRTPPGLGSRAGIRLWALPVVCPRPLPSSLPWTGSSVIGWGAGDRAPGGSTAFSWDVGEHVYGKLGSFEEGD